MLPDETLKALIEAIIYVAPEPVSLDAIVKALEGEERERVKAKLEEMVADFERADHGIQIRQVAGASRSSPTLDPTEYRRTSGRAGTPPTRPRRRALKRRPGSASAQPGTH